MTTPSATLPAPPVRERRWLPAVAVAAVIAAVVSGGYLTADALGEVEGGAVTIDGGIVVTPLPGWELAERFPDPPGVRLTNGNTSLDVATIPFSGSTDELLASYVDGGLGPAARQFHVSGEFERVTLPPGLTGSRIAYVGRFGDVGASIEGEVTAVVSPSGRGVAFDGWAPAGQLEFGLDEVDTMIENAEIA